MHPKDIHRTLPTPTSIELHRLQPHKHRPFRSQCAQRRVELVRRDADLREKRAGVVRRLVRWGEARWEWNGVPRAGRARRTEVVEVHGGSYGSGDGYARGIGRRCDQGRHS
jgi:hypothetical protein